MICTGLEPRQRRVLPLAMRTQVNNNQQGLKQVIRIRDEEGNATKGITKKQKFGRHVRTTKGSARQRPCYVCRKYQAKYVFTSFACADCRTPMCHPTKKHTGRSTGGWDNCIQEHKNSVVPGIKCSGCYLSTFPKDYKLV